MKICAYHGNLYFTEFQNHAYEMISKGFDTILFPISETDATFNLSTFQKFVEHTDSIGMNTMACFWGLYAGEAIRRNMSVEEWMEKVLSIGIRNILIDEPRIFQLDIDDFIDYNLKVNLYCVLADDVFAQLSDEHIKSFPVKMLGVSCYHWTDDWCKIYNRTKSICERLKSLRPDDCFIFIQGFDIKKDREFVPLVVKNEAIKLGIENFGFWSFRANEATGVHKSDDPELIWRLFNL